MAMYLAFGLILHHSVTRDWVEAAFVSALFGTLTIWLLRRKDSLHGQQLHHGGQPPSLTK
jgi:hypothetical protein